MYKLVKFCKVGAFVFKIIIMEMGTQAFRGTILRPNIEEDDGFERIDDGIVVVQGGEVLCVTTVDEFRGDFAEKYSRIPGLKLREADSEILCYDRVVPSTRNVITTGMIDTHCHTFQPPGREGPLVTQDERGQMVGWLPATLPSELDVKRNPKKAREWARTLFTMYIENGITGALNYTTSSEEAARIVLEVADEMDFGDRIKVGFVAMDHGIRDFGEGLDELEGTVEGQLAATERLLEEFGDRIVVIDRFPLAVCSELRKGLAELARKHGVLYETHVNEAVEEIGFTRADYEGRSILQVLKDDGVFEENSKVGLAHGIHMTDDDFEIIREAVANGCEIYVRLCPDSNGQLHSAEIPEGWVRLVDGSYIPETEFDPEQHERLIQNVAPYPLQRWIDAGAIPTFGLDKGAGRGHNIAAEMLSERKRVHEGGDPDALDLWRFGTTYGMVSLGMEPDDELIPGEAANFVVLTPDLRGIDGMPDDLNELIACTIEGASDSSGVQWVYLNGKTVKADGKVANL